MQDILDQIQIDVDAMMYKRVERTQLKPGYQYVRVHFGKTEFVGEFQRSYTSGSGDGMTIHYEFSWNGYTYTIHDDMWGSVSGDELMHFYENPTA